jgi:hypothetical protein
MTDGSDLVGHLGRQSVRAKTPGLSPFPSDALGDGSGGLGALACTSHSGICPKGKCPRSISSATAVAAFPTRYPANHCALCKPIHTLTAAGFHQWFHSRLNATGCPIAKGSEGLGFRSNPSRRTTRVSTKLAVIPTFSKRLPKQLSASRSGACGCATTRCRQSLDSDTEENATILA